MIESIIIGILFVVAIVYVIKKITKSYKPDPDEGCSKNCDC